MKKTAMLSKFCHMHVFCTIDRNDFIHHVLIIVLFQQHEITNIRIGIILI